MVRPAWTTGPVALTLVRHAQSMANRADELAREAGAEELGIRVPDVDVELSETGRAQACAVRRWLAGQAGPDLPTVVLTSPYLRARETAERSVAGLGLEVVHDDRLRERDLGLLSGLTEVGIRARHPEEVERRRRLGDFYYQPPSGESWPDVALRVRSLLEDLRSGYGDEKVWLFTHQAVVMAFRYVLEELPAERLVEIDRHEPPANASLTRYRRSGEALELDRFADTSAVDLTARVTDGARGVGQAPHRSGE